MKDGRERFKWLERRDLGLGVAAVRHRKYQKKNSNKNQMRERKKKQKKKSRVRPDMAVAENKTNTKKGRKKDKGNQQKDMETTVDSLASRGQTKAPSSTIISSTVIDRVNETDLEAGPKSIKTDQCP